MFLARPPTAALIPLSGTLRGHPAPPRPRRLHPNTYGLSLCGGERLAAFSGLASDTGWARFRDTAAPARAIFREGIKGAF